MKRILWISRHSPMQKQIQELEDCFEQPVDMIQVSTNIQDPREVKELMSKYGASEVVAILPLKLLGKLAAMGIKPIQAVMSRDLDKYNEPVFTHERFEVVESVEVVTRPLVSYVKGDRK